jgi:hypothetical protein
LENWSALLLGNCRRLWHKKYMHSQNIDYAAIKDRLKSLQPKNRVETRNAQLAHLREELRNARKRGVSINALSAELKAAGITISSAALAKYLSSRSSNSQSNTVKKRTPAANRVAKPHGQVKTETKEPEHRESGTDPK